MPTRSEIEATARVLCQNSVLAAAGTRAHLRLDSDANGRGPLGVAIKRWDTFAHDARLAPEAAESVRAKDPDLRKAQIRVNAPALPETPRDAREPFGPDRVGLPGRRDA